MSMKRIVPILAILCVLGVGLVAPATAHAQVHTQHISQQQLVANDSGGTYFFDAGWWGWGLCLSHNTLQGIYDWSTVRLVVSATSSGRVANWRLQLARVMLWLYLGSLKEQDQGRGMCIAWPYYIPSTVPIAWPQ
jgi:hypothetical protein